MSSVISSVARAELRRGWMAVVIVGLLGGLVAATVIGSLSLARRTVTAYDRLGEATGVDDARGTVLHYPEVADQVVALPQVTEHWLGRIAVGKVEDTESFLGVIAGPEEPSELRRPIAIDGRLPRDDGDRDTVEIALRDDFQREFDVPLGSEFVTRFLTEEDFYRFDVGFVGGEPHGPELRLRIVGTFRVAERYSDTPPGLAGPDMIEQHADALLGRAWFVRLDGGRAAYEDFSRDVLALDDELRLPPVAAQFSVVDVRDTAEASAAADHTANLLARALAALAAAVGVVGLVAVVQVHLRHHAARAGDVITESALGITRRQQLIARALSGSASALLAVLVGGAGAVVASRIDAVGAIRQYEPHPGPALNVALVVIGLVLTATIVLASCLLTSLIATRRRASRSLRESRLSDAVARLGGAPSTVIGLRFALEPSRGRRVVPVRSTILGVVVGVVGVTSGIVYATSLDRVVDSPSRSGIPYDVSVADVDADDLGDLVDHPSLADVALVTGASLEIDGRSAQGHAIEPVHGEIDIDLADGREPRTPDEIVLGLRIAKRLDKGVGDTVALTGQDGAEVVLAVVGTGVVPAFDGEQLGLNALVTPAALRRVGLARPFPGAVATAAPGVDPASLPVLFNDAGFEADAERTPTEVDNLRQLGRIPSTVSGLVGAVAVVALANALNVLTRRRRGDLALLRAIGCSGRQTGSAIVVMSLTIALIGVVIGLPVGIAVGGTLWRLTASGAFITTDVLLQWLLFAAVAGAAIAVALVAAVLPARRAASLPPASFLRAE